MCASARLRLGANVPTVGGLSTGLRWAQEWSLACAQLYVTPSRTWSVPPIDSELIEAFRRERTGISSLTLVSHVPFLVNLANPDPDKWESSVSRLATELVRAAELGVDEVVMHPGSALGGDRNTGLRRVASGIEEAHARTDRAVPRLSLETMAGQGTMLGASVDEIGEVLDACTSCPPLGICVDTAHVFEAGYDLSCASGYEQFFDTVSERIGVARISVIHINDSKTALASRRDLHAAPGEGMLGDWFFHRLLSDRRFDAIPKVVELPDRKRTPEVIRQLESLASQSLAPPERRSSRQLQLELTAQSQD